MASTLKITPTRKSTINSTTVNISGVCNSSDAVVVKIQSPNAGIENNLIYASYDENGGDGNYYYGYYRDVWIIGTYKVTVEFNQSYPQKIDGTFEIVSEDVFSTPIMLNYPTSIRQMESFNWSVDNGKPGETLNYVEAGPVTISHNGIPLEANYDYDPPTGYHNITSVFEYAGDYTVTCNFSRSTSVSKTIKVIPKIYVVYPSNVIAIEPFTYSISGGDPNETWTANIDGPTPSSISGTLGADGKASYTNGVIGSNGSYTITFTFSKSGKFKQEIFAVPSSRSGIHPAGTALFYSEINDEFLVGYDLDQYRDRRWYLSLDDPSWDSNQGLGNFTTYDLSFYQFYSKRAIDPVVPGQLYYGSPGYYTWPVPANRNGITIEGWGAGGGTNGGPSGENTTINAGNYYMVAGGGGTAGAGGRRYGAPPAGGGTWSGNVDVGINGEDGSWSSAYGNGGKGGDSPRGGTGGAPRGVNQGNNPGNAPGGGASGVSGRDYSKYPAFGFSSGGGGGAYVSATVPLKRGALVAFNVGNGYSGGAPGAVRITWS